MTKNDMLEALGSVHRIPEEGHDHQNRPALRGQRRRKRR
jgi:hypothetical protein